MGLMFSVAAVEMKKLEIEKELKMKKMKIDSEMKKLEMKRIELELKKAQEFEFPFKNAWLASLGLKSLIEQYFVYLTIIGGVVPFAYSSRKHYLMRQYVKETTFEGQKFWALKFPFDPADLDSAELYLKKNGRSKYWWLLGALVGPLYVMKRAKES